MSEKSGNKPQPKKAVKANPKGRPTKYKEEYCKSIIEYFDRPPQQTVFKKTYYSDGTIKSEEPIVLPTQFPTIQGFAHDIGVNKDTLYEWGKVHDEFSDALTHAQELQEKIWLVNGMGGQYNAQFAQFFGKNCLGYKDKQEIDQTSTTTDLTDMTTEERQKRIEELLSK